LASRSASGEVPGRTSAGRARAAVILPATASKGPGDDGHEAPTPARQPGRSRRLRQPHKRAGAVGHSTGRPGTQTKGGQTSRSEAPGAGAGDGVRLSRKGPRAPFRHAGEGMSRGHAPERLTRRDRGHSGIQGQGCGDGPRAPNTAVRTEPASYRNEPDRPVEHPPAPFEEEIQGSIHGGHPTSPVVTDSAISARDARRNPDANPDHKSRSTRTTSTRTSPRDSSGSAHTPRRTSSHIEHATNERDERG